MWALWLTSEVESSLGGTESWICGIEPHLQVRQCGKVSHIFWSRGGMFLLSIEYLYKCLCEGGEAHGPVCCPFYQPCTTYLTYLCFQSPSLSLLELHFCRCDKMLQQKATLGWKVLFGLQFQTRIHHFVEIKTEAQAAGHITSTGMSTGNKCILACLRSLFLL